MGDVYGGCAPRTHPGKYENGKSDGFAPAKKIGRVVSPQAGARA